MSKIENLLDIARLNELLGRKEEEEEKACRKVVWVLAIIGVSLSKSSFPGRFRR